MHLGNSIVCPVTGIPMIIAAGVASVWAFKKAKKDFTKEKIIPTVVLTAFVFCMQMINMTIPTTSSSGHLVGGILLACLLGPYVGFLSMCTILLVQCLFFADGGILALGCNVFNMGFLACFVAYPVVFKLFENKNKPYIGIVIASLVALELGAVCAAIEGTLSGAITNLALFAYLMCGIHFIIGLMEGVMSAIIYKIANISKLSKTFSYSVATICVVIAGFISQFRSTNPDGLEWSLLKMPESFVEQTQGQIFTISENLQAKTAILSNMPDVSANIIGLAVIVALSTGLFIMLAHKETEKVEA